MLMRPASARAKRHAVATTATTSSASSPTTTCGNCCADHVSARYQRHAGSLQAQTAGDLPDGGNRVSQVLGRVPYHAAFLDDPAFRGPDQAVVADDNTENHRRGDDLGAGEGSAGKSETAERRGHRAGRPLDPSSSIPPGEDDVAEPEPEAEASEEKTAEDAPPSREAQERDSRRWGLPRRRRTHRPSELGFGLVLYLLVLPIIYASGHPPAGAGLVTQLRNGTGSRNASESRHPYRDYNWEVNQINPWLSACDLAGPAPADLQGSCGPPETPKNCPGACSRGADARTPRALDSFFAVVGQAVGFAGPGPPGGWAVPEQCLFYLEESHKAEICRDGFGTESSAGFPTVRENRFRFLSGLRLRHCCEHAALNALAGGDGGPLEEVLAGGLGCSIALGKLLAVDALAARLHCEFAEVLARYDCGQPYSVIYDCSHCKEAYRRWVCSSLVPYFAHDDPPPQKNDGLAGARVSTGMRIRPCRSFCQSVEQRCPYLLPGDRAPAYPTQYAGEPTFLCRDPNIPETGEQASRALHADEECCFHVCSDDDPALGVCANCTEPQVEMAIRGGDTMRDPSTAPQCELNSASSGQNQQQSPTLSSWPDDSDTILGSSVPQSEEFDVSGTSQRSLPMGSGTSFCGSGGFGSMTSSSSSRVIAASSLPIIMCAFCVWGLVIGVYAIELATSLRTYSIMVSTLSYPKPFRPRLVIGSSSSSSGDSGGGGGGGKIVGVDSDVVKSIKI